MINVQGSRDGSTKEHTNQYEINQVQRSLYLSIYLYICLFFIFYFFPPNPIIRVRRLNMYYVSFCLAQSWLDHRK